MIRGEVTDRVRAVGVVLPVHNEEERLRAALEAIEVAVSVLPPATSRRVVIVLDDCRDGSAGLACSWAQRAGALVIATDCQSVGAARRAGCGAALSLWPSLRPAEIWIATTDADSRVPQDWLTVQLEARRSGADLWAGRVSVVEDSAAVRRWMETYAAESDPIHGASLGFGADLYEHVGGFGCLRTGEDRDFHRRAVAAGYRVRYDRRAAVTTSARRRGRAPGGFAAVLGGVGRDTFEVAAS